MSDAYTVHDDDIETAKDLVRHLRAVQRRNGQLSDGVAGVLGIIAFELLSPDNRQRARALMDAEGMDAQVPDRPGLLKRFATFFKRRCAT